MTDLAIAHDHPAGGGNCDPGCPAWTDTLVHRQQQLTRLVEAHMAWKQILRRSIAAAGQLIAVLERDLGPQWPAVLVKFGRRYDRDLRNRARLIRIRDRRRDRRIRRAHAAAGSH